MEPPGSFHTEYNFKKDKKIITVDSGKHSPTYYFHPFRPCCQGPILSLDEFQCPKLSLFKHNWAYSRLGKIVCNCNRTKLTQGKITLYTVYFVIKNKLYSPSTHRSWLGQRKIIWIDQHINFQNHEKVI